MGMSSFTALRPRSENEFTCAAGLLRVEALADDVFRVRATPRASWEHPASDAVCHRAARSSQWSCVRRGAQWVFQTEAGRIELSARSGLWTLKDSAGLPVFSSATPLEADGSKLRIEFALAERDAVFGLGETTGPMNRRGQTREFWNIDVLGHAPGIHPQLRRLYVSIPFAVVLRDGRAAGLFWDNSARQVWSVGDERRDRWALSADSGELDLYLFLGPTPSAVLARFTELTGRIPMPPLWGLGYHQCRYSYRTRQELEAVAREFRQRGIPCDALYLDIHHMDGYRVFSFGRTFPKPAEMIRRLRRKGFRVVAIVDPGVKDDAKFGVLKRGRAAGAFVRDASGTADILGEVWPGRSRFPDFLNPAARAWWGREQAALQRAGVAGFWNDMNEPANFARPDKTLPPDAQHRTEAGQRSHAEVHNLYGSAMARASREGALATAPEERPFVITRAGYAGIQRQALVWTGDNSSTWEHLSDALQMLVNLGASGVPFCGADVGGFLGNCTPELFVRWLQFAVFTPFLRNHSNIDTHAREPWAFGAEVEHISRQFIGLRYRLLPYLYGLLAEARETGAPPMRPLWWHHPNDAHAVGCDDAFLLGADLLVAPVLRPGACARSVYLPNGVWFDFWTGERWIGGQAVLVETPLDRIPLFFRAGAVIPLGEPVPCVDALPRDVAGIHLWPGGRGQFRWYDDDGVSQRYERLGWVRHSLSLNHRGHTVELTIGPAEGGYVSPVERWRLVLWQVPQSPRVRVDGEMIEHQFDPEFSRVTVEIPRRSNGAMIRFIGVR
jgi:alpha-glucosidase